MRVLSKEKLESIIKEAYNLDSDISLKKTKITVGHYEQEKVNNFEREKFYKLFTFKLDKERTVEIIFAESKGYFKIVKVMENHILKKFSDSEVYDEGYINYRSFLKELVAKTPTEVLNYISGLSNKKDKPEKKTSKKKSEE